MFIILILYGRFAGAQRAFFMSRSETLRDMKRIFVMQRPYLLILRPSAVTHPQASTVKQTAFLSSRVTV